ncbi:MAG: T9SS type A sorting domain-containing protein [Bacteroidetes bacterium]|nr:T9SS type A sorting domain-containing protein [Bacteroidota bacterium]
MKRILGFLLLVTPLFALAGTGDTMTVRSHDRVHMNWNGNYDRKVFFPTAGKTYQRVKMRYTLGCPDKGCSAWDYTVQAFLRQPTGMLDSNLVNSPNFKVNGKVQDSLFYNMDSVYSYFYNSTSMALDSMADMPVQLLLFSDTLNPTTPTDTLNVWDALRYRPTYDANGNVVDSMMIAHDKSIYRKDFDWYNVFEVINNLELGRLITPYAGDKDKTWSFTYTYDVTEFAMLLQDSVTIRSHFSGYQDGFTCTIDFEFLEGEPALKCTEIIPLWVGSFPYGAKKSIEEYLTEKSVNISKTSTTRVKLQVIQTGHGFGGNENCAEFCAKEHYIKVNGTQQFKQLVWKDDCGSNPIYPQTGTWLYDRSNWCPGEGITPYEYWLDDYINDGNNTIDMDMQAFTNIDNSNTSYIISGILFNYEENPNAIVDVALDEIVAPNTQNNYVRFNPTCGLPRVVVKNTSLKTVETLVFRYGIKGGNLREWGWEGEILPYQSKTIDLDYFDWSGASTGEFVCEIIKANGAADGNQYNNAMESSFELTPQFPGQFQIWFKANTKGSENTLSVHLLDGREIWSRGNFSSNESTKDTINLVDGCYYFKVTDSQRNGFKFWANSDGTGSLTLRQMNGQLVQFIDGDFGTDRIVHFTVGHPLGQKLVIRPEMKVYPNPSKGLFTVSYTGQGSGQLRILDMNGKVINCKAIEEMGLVQSTWNLNGIKPGIYLVEYMGPDGRSVQKIVIE